MIETDIKDCYILKASIYNDHRGSFSELHKASSNSFNCKQVNYSFSKSGTLRGLHKAPYSKLVSCVYGKVFDVCVDLRPDSPTYMRSVYLNLDNNLEQLYIPPNCAHGFYAYTDSIILYLQDGEYQKEKDETFCYKSYNIPWPAKPIFISEKDEKICN